MGDVRNPEVGDIFRKLADGEVVEIDALGEKHVYAVVIRNSNELARALRSGLVSKESSQKGQRRRIGRGHLRQRYQKGI